MIAKSSRPFAFSLIELLVVVSVIGLLLSVLVPALGYRTRADGAYHAAVGGEDPPTNRWFSGSGRDDDPPDKPST